MIEDLFIKIESYLIKTYLFLNLKLIEIHKQFLNCLYDNL